ncbi:MAG: hypothetical protein Q9165_002614 [Trypethelium subeluteriae]
MAAADGDPLQMNAQYQEILSATAGPQPNFEAMNDHVQGLGEQLQRCSNLPTVRGPAALVQIIIAHMDGRFNRVDTQIDQVNTQINQVNTRLNTGFEEIRQRLDASEQNAVARVQNSLLNHRHETLTPLVNPLTNGPIANFPITSAHIDELDLDAINLQLTTLGKSIVGNMPQKRQRLRIAIGLTPTRRTVTTTGTGA